MYYKPCQQNKLCKKKEEDLKLQVKKIFFKFRISHVEIDYEKIQECLSIYEIVFKKINK